MPNKGSSSNRERKRSSQKKDFDKNGKYSSKHIRQQEEQFKKSQETNNETNKTNKKNEKNKK